jgi:hypothetical protein
VQPSFVTPPPQPPRPYQSLPHDQTSTPVLVDQLHLSVEEKNIIGIIRDNINNITERISKRASDWIGCTEYTGDIRLTIVKREESKPDKDQNEISLAERSFAIEFEAYRQNALGVKWDGLYSRLILEDKSRIKPRRASLKKWVEKSLGLNSNPPQALSKTRATKRGLICLAFEEKFGPGFQPFFSLCRLKFFNLSQKSQRTIAQFLESAPECQTTRKIMQSEQARFHVLDTQALFHKNHGLSHLNDAWSNIRTQLAQRQLAQQQQQQQQALDAAEALRAMRQVKSLNVTLSSPPSTIDPAGMETTNEEFERATDQDCE